MVLDLKTGVGVSTLGNDFNAGSQAAKRALESLGERSPDALLVFAAPKFNQQKMLDGITSVAKDTPMVGGTTAGEISSFGLSVGSVVVMALKSKDVDFHIGIGKGISKGEEKAGVALAKNVLKNCKNRKTAKTLITMPDGLAGDGLKVIQGVQKVLGKDFEIVGGSFGDEANFKQTYQYYNGKVYKDVVVGMLICGNGIKTGTGVRSGWESVGAKVRCTKANGNVVYRFGNQTALEYYREALGPSRAKKLPAIGLEYPLGLVDEKAKIEGYDYFQIRAPLAINEKDGSVTFAAAIPEGSEVTLTYSSRNSIVRGSKLSAQQAKNSLEGARPRLALLFSCVARKMVLGRRTNEEINSVKQVLGRNIPIAGFYTYGEIGPLDKRVPKLKDTRWHNETMVMWVLGD